MAQVPLRFLGCKERRVSADPASPDPKLFEQVSFPIYEKMSEKVQFFRTKFFNLLESPIVLWLRRSLQSSAPINPLEADHGQTFQSNMPICSDGNGEKGRS
jgi:hypothetical protein